MCVANFLMQKPPCSSARATWELTCLLTRLLFESYSCHLIKKLTINPSLILRAYFIFFSAAFIINQHTKMFCELAELLLVICEWPGLQLVFFWENFIVQVDGQNLKRKYKEIDSIFHVCLKIFPKLGYVEPGLAVLHVVLQMVIVGSKFDATLKPKPNKKFSRILGNWAREQSLSVMLSSAGAGL